jgi:hypothetical protein
MDAQACRVSGVADILIGDRQEAAAIRVKTELSDAIIIFDTAFLAKSAPPENAMWLRELYEESSR